MNGINRKIATFFESVRNGDTALRYPNKTNDPFVKDLYTEMNRIILLFSQNQSEMEEKRLYYESILRVLTHEIRNSITPIRSLSADLLKYSDTYTPKQYGKVWRLFMGKRKIYPPSWIPTIVWRISRSRKEPRCL